MSVINGVPFSCDQTTLDCCQLLKKMLVFDSLGQPHINDLMGLTGQLYFNFTDAELQTIDFGDGFGDRIVYLLTHNLNKTVPGIIIANNEYIQQDIVGYRTIDENSGYIIIDSHITGTWHGRAF